MSSSYLTTARGVHQPRLLPSAWYPSPHSYPNDQPATRWRNNNSRHTAAQPTPRESRATHYSNPLHTPHGRRQSHEGRNQTLPSQSSGCAHIKNDHSTRHPRIRSNSGNYASPRAPELLYPSPPDSCEERHQHTLTRKRSRPDEDDATPQKRAKSSFSDTDGGIPIPYMEISRGVAVPAFEDFRDSHLPSTAFPPLVRTLPLSLRPKEIPRFTRWEEPRLPALDTLSQWLAEVIHATVIFVEDEDDHVHMSEEVHSQLALMIKGVLSFLPYQTTVIFLALWYIRRMIPKGFLRQGDFTKGVGIGTHAVARLWTVAMVLAYKWQDDISWRTTDLLSGSPIPRKHINNLERQALIALDHQVGISNSDWRCWLEEVRDQPIPGANKLPERHREMRITLDGLLKKAGSWPHRRSTSSPPAPASLSVCGELYVLLQLFPVESEERFRRRILSLGPLHEVHRHLDWNTIRGVMSCKIKAGPPTPPPSRQQPLLSPLTSINAEIPHDMLCESPIYRYPYTCAPIFRLPANLVLPFLPPGSDTSGLIDLAPVEPIVDHVNQDDAGPAWLYT